jgi:hypothetical protein
LGSGAGPGRFDPVLSYNVKPISKDIRLFDHLKPNCHIKYMIEKISKAAAE